MKSVVSLDLTNKYNVCKWQLKHYLDLLKDIEIDSIASENDKLLKIKIIREEISKVGMEIDTIKKEIMILNTRHIN